LSRNKLYDSGSNRQLGVGSTGFSFLAVFVLDAGLLIRHIMTWQRFQGYTKICQCTIMPLIRIIQPVNHADVVELVDTLALGASAARREGSSPFIRTK
jgi:hypothetical protein